MKEGDLQPCGVCNKGLMHTGLPLFWKVSIERYGIDAAAVHRQVGLGMMLGSGRLATVMGPDEDMATRIGDTVDILMCEDCVLQNYPIAAIAEMSGDLDDDGIADFTDTKEVTGT